MELFDKFKGVLAALISAGTFGLIPLFSIPLMTTAGMNQTSILIYRFVISSAAILIYCLIGNKSLSISPKVTFKLFGLSLLYSATALALLSAYNHLPSGVVTTIHFIYPVVVVVFMSIFYKEPISLKLICTSVLALVGVGFLSFSGGGRVDLFGLILAISTAITYGLYLVAINDRDIRLLGGKVTAFYVMMFGAFSFAIVNLVMGIDFSPIPDFTAWGNLLMLALFPTIISVLTLVYAVKYVGSTVTAILGAAEPLVATCVGVFIFSERFTIDSFIGFILIIVAVSYIIFLTSEKKSVNRLKIKK